MLWKGQKCLGEVPRETPSFDLFKYHFAKSHKTLRLPVNFTCFMVTSPVFAGIFPRQRKLMGSSAQNSSGVHWRRRIRFNEVPEKVPKVPEKVPGGFGAEPGQVQQDLRPLDSRKPS
jgi:hypothetical protein